MGIEKTRVRARAYLQDATREAHQRAEARWTRGGTFTDRASYDAWLARMLEVHMRIGQSAAHVALWPQGPALEAMRADLLRQDLSVGATGPEPAIEVEKDEAWGVLYALNGSALGASHLLRTEVTDLGWPTGYLREMAQFARTGKLGFFFKDLDAWTGDPDRAVAGALHVFDAIAA